MGSQQMANGLVNLLYTLNQYFVNYEKKLKKYYSDGFFVLPKTVGNIYDLISNVKLTHYLSNKGSFSKYLHTINLTNSLLCKSGNLEVGTPEHVIYQSTKTTDARLQFFD